MSDITGKPFELRGASDSNFIETLFGEMMAWINESCPNIDYREVAEQEQRLRYLLENGGDAATLSVPCYTVGMGLVTNSVNQDINTLKHIIAHDC